MYLPAHFTENRPEVLHDFMCANPLATLVTSTAAGPQADHIPLHLDISAKSADSPHGVLIGHVARANPLWQQHLPHADILAIFHGPQAYISPSWYPSKHDHGKAVPTWNYVAVHARGRLRVVDDPLWLRAQLAVLVGQHEADLPAPWRIEDAPADYIDAMLKAIVGIEISITHLVGKWKISQNQPASNRAGVVAGLRERDGESAMAALVVKTHGT